MPIYTYKACNLQGKLVKGRREFSTKAELVEALKKGGLLLISVKERYAGFIISRLLKRISVSRSKARDVEKKSAVGVLQKISQTELMSFSLQLSNMLGAGINLLKSLSILIEQISNKKFKMIIEKIHHDVEAGSSFSIALEVYPRVFSPLFVNMVKMGELTGKLDSTLSKSAEFIEHDLDLRQKLKAALIYPVILLSLGFMIVMFITIFVMPRFVAMFQEAGIKLSLPTLIVYGFGQTVQRFWYLLIIGSFLLIRGIKFYLKTKTASLALDNLIFKIPLIGPIAHKAILARFAMTLNVLVTTGIPLLESLDMVEKVVGNAAVAKVIKDARAQIGRGSKIADALKMSDKFPPDVIQMIAVGEETGGLDKMLAKIANFYDATLSADIKTLTVFLEPIFLLIMGLVVSFLMFSIFIPLFKMIQTVRI